MGLPSSPIKTWGKSVQGFLSYDRTNKPTEITTLYLYIDINVFNILNNEMYFFQWKMQKVAAEEKVFLLDTDQLYKLALTYFKVSLFYPFCAQELIFNIL